VGLASVSCPSLTQCTAGDDSYPTGQYVTFDPQTGAVVSGPTPVTSNDGSLIALDCTSTSLCTGVAFYGDVLSFNPTTGTVSEGPTATGGVYLRGVACASANQCTVVDDHGQAISFDPTNPGTPATPTIDAGTSLKSVACVSTVECVAVDQVGQVFTSARSLAVSLAGSGSGTVSGTSLTCPGTCTGYYGIGAGVTLTATPAPGSTFTGWSGGGCSGTGACNVTLNSDQKITATFTAKPPGSGPTGSTAPATVASAGSPTVSGSSATVPITCTGAASAQCGVALSLTTTETLKNGKVVSISKVKTKHQTITVGSGTATVLAGEVQHVKVTLNGTGTSLLRRFHTLHATLTVTQTTATGTAVLETEKLTFKERKRKKR
jgi:hypothetical protein